MSDDKKDLVELKKLADKLGVPYGPNIGYDLLHSRVHEKTQPKPEPEPKKIVQKEKVDVSHSTPDDVLEAISAITSRNPSFIAEFDDDTWRFTCNGAEDSGNMAIPLRVIVMKAESVAKGARRPRGMRNSSGQIVMLA